MVLTSEKKLRPAIEALQVNSFVDLPKDDFTASAARQAVNRICTDEASALADGGVTGDFIPKKYRVSETAYPGGTRVTRIQ